jgi:hypothetical protein
MNPRVKSVKPGDDYRLRITFTNGEKGIYDCRPLLNFGVFKELQDDTYFRQVRAENGTVVWPHEQDICPDTVYLDSVKTRKNKAQQATSIKSPSRKSAPGNRSF